MSEPPNADPPPTDAELRALYERALYAPRAATGTSGPAVTPEALRDLVEGVGTESERLATLDRVMADPRLHGEFELLRATAAAARAVDPGARVPRAPTRTPAVRWALAAAACLVVAVGLGMWTRPEAPDQTRGEPSGADGSDVRVSLVPAAIPPAGGALTLAWRPVPGAVRYDVEVLDRAGTPRLAESTVDTTLTVPPMRAAAVRAGDGWWVRARLAGGATARSGVVPLGAP